MDIYQVNLGLRQTLAAMLCGSFDELDFGFGFLFALVSCFFEACVLSPFKKKKFTKLDRYVYNPIPKAKTDRNY